MLTKSDFKLANDCLRKLSYKLRGYPARDDENGSLSEEAGKVEALARALFPTGSWVVPAQGETPVAATRRMLAGAGDTVLYEATIEAGGLLCRADILVREGGVYRIYEVKSSCVDEDAESPFRTTRGGVAAEWLEELEDVAFQVLVLRRALGRDCAIEPHLICLDTSGSADAAVNRWNVVLEPSADGRPARHVFRGTEVEVRQSGLLRVLPAGPEVRELLQDGGEEGGIGLEARVDELLGKIANGEVDRVPPPVGPSCKDCQYRKAAEAADSRDGYGECWGPEQPAGHLPDLFRAGTLGVRGRMTLEDLYRQGKRSLLDIPDASINESKAGAKRQRMQLQAARTGRVLRDPGLVAELEGLGSRLHFIDFETARLAVPAFPGDRPYELQVFQYSCHSVAIGPDGKAELSHAGWIHDGSNGGAHLEFATRLRASLGDEVPVLTWSSFERTCLEEVRLLLAYEGGHDDLVGWLAALTGSDGSEGRLVDLHRMCVDSYIHPAMRGSTSIKVVLPAVLSSDAGLRQHPWFADRLGGLSSEETDPYAHLPGVTTREGELSVVRDGLAAQQAYVHILQAARAGDAATIAACQRLLEQYCHLDTLAMVMVWWHWRSGSVS